LTPEQLEPLYYREALAWIRSHPGAWLALTALKVFYTIVPIVPSYAVHSSRYIAASVIPYALVLTAALVGARRARGMSGRRAVEPLWLMGPVTNFGGVMLF